MKRALLAAIALLAFATAARADDIPPCPVPAGVTAATQDAGAPAALLNYVRTHYGPLAGPGQPFNATDVVTEGYPDRRFILLWGRGSRWVLAYEQGGIAYNDPVIVLGVVGNAVSLGPTRLAVPPTVCATVHALIGK